MNGAASAAAGGPSALALATSSADDTITAVDEYGWEDIEEPELCLEALACTSLLR